MTLTSRHFFQPQDKLEEPTEAFQRLPYQITKISQIAAFQDPPFQW